MRQIENMVQIQKNGMLSIALSEVTKESDVNIKLSQRTEPGTMKNKGTREQTKGQSESISYSRQEIYRKQQIKWDVYFYLCQE